MQWLRSFRNYASFSLGQDDHPGQEHAERRSSLERFKAGVTIAFGESKKFGWTTKYVNGRLDDTLQEVDFVESAFSVKF
jgi:hypothetical protein